MKGLIFSEFLEMVGEQYSAEMVELIIDDADLPNQGAYTDIGTYDHEEIVRLVISLHKRVHLPIEQLLVVFGEYLFKKFVTRYKHFIAEMTGVFDCLKKVDQYIHVEVMKIYPDAVLPKFDCTEISDKQLLMLYQSNHPFASLAEGLIMGCAKHFDQTVEVQKKILPATAVRKYIVEFAIILQGTQGVDFG